MGKITKHAWFYDFSLTILQSCHLFMTDTQQPPEAASFVCSLQISSSRSFSWLHAPCCPCWGALPCGSLPEVERELETEGEALSSPQVSPSARPSAAPPHSCRLRAALHELLKSCVVVVLCSAGSWTVNYLQGRIWGIFTFAVWSLITTRNVFVRGRKHEIGYIDIIFNSFIEEWCLLLSLILLYFSFFSSYSCSIL